jgi:hypothetical protein
LGAGWEGEGESPDENMGSDEPVKRDAAVAAAATLFQKSKRCNGSKIIYITEMIDLTPMDRGATVTG